MKKSILPLLSILVLILLFLFPKLSFEGAKSGLLLWFNVVLPTLFPFMLCSSLIVAWGGVKYLMKPFGPLISLFHLSEAGGYTWVCGLLCGYPMGAKTAADFVKSREISLQEGKRLLAISACPSPMFLAGYVKSCLPEALPFWQISLSIYLPVLLLALFSGFCYRTNGQNKSTLRNPLPVLDTSENPKSDLQKGFDDIMMDAMEIMVKIGGYIMMFSILAAYAEHLFPSGLFFKPVLLGFIEMTTGIQAISLSVTGAAQSAFALAAAAFGGLSGLFQTKSVIKNAGLSIRHYMAWKLLHAGLTYGIFILLYLL